MASDIKNIVEQAAENKKNGREIEKLSKSELIDLIYGLKGRLIERDSEIEDLTTANLKNESNVVKYSNLFNNSPVGYLIINNDGIIIETNDTLAEMLKVDKEHLVNMPFSRFIAVEDIDTFNYFRRKIANTKSLHVCDMKIVNHDGRLQNVKLEGIVLAIDEQKANRQAIIISDNTASKTMEKMLRESEKKYRHLIEGLNEGVFKMSLPDGRYDYVSTSIQYVFGIPLEKIYSNAPLINKIIHPDLKERFEQRWQEILDGKVDPTYEYKIIDNNGKERWILQSNRGIYDENGKIVALEGLCRNITEVKLAEKALRDSEERFRAIANYTYDWENWTDPDGVLIWINPSVERITGYSVEECMSMKDFPLPIIHDEERDEVREKLKKSLDNQDEGSLQFRIKRKDGEIRWMAAVWQPLYNMKGKYRGHRSSIRDVTERVDAEETMQHLIEEMRKSNELIKKQVFEYNEIKNKYNAERNRHKQFKEKTTRFLSEVSEDFVNTFTQFTRILRMITLTGDDIDREDLHEKAGELLKSSESSIKMIEKYFREIGIE